MLLHLSTPVPFHSSTERVRVYHRDVQEVIRTAVSKLRLQMDPPTVWSARATVSLVNERIQFLILTNQECF